MPSVVNWQINGFQKMKSLVQRHSALVLTILNSHIYLSNPASETITVNDFLINESVSLLFIGNGLGYLIPPMIVTGPENAFNQSESWNNMTNWNEDAFGQEFSLKLTLKISHRLSQSFKLFKAKFRIKLYFYTALHLALPLLSQELSKNKNKSLIQ